MRGMFLDCKNCKKKLAKDVYLRNGSRITFRCHFCGVIAVLAADGGELHLTCVFPKGYTVEKKQDDSPEVEFFGV